MQNINAAYRVREILIQARNQPNMSVVQLWAGIFNIDEASENKKSFEVSRCLTQLHEEIETIREQMQDTGFSESLFDPWLDRANSAIGVQTIAGTWDSYKPFVSSELILCLGFCSEILDSEEQKISEEEIQEILKLLDPLETHLQDSTLPIATAKIIRKHIEKIKEALHSYPIKGAKALNDVMQSAYGEVVDNVQVFEESKEVEQVKELSKVWQKVKSVLDSATTVDKGASSIHALTDKAQKLIEVIQTIT